MTGSLFNPVGTSISTLIPTGYSNAVSNLSLSLVAQSGIYNAGSIISAGSLSATAPVIANVHPSTIGATGPAAIMQAMTGNLNLIASNMHLVVIAHAFEEPQSFAGFLDALLELGGRVQ